MPLHPVHDGVDGDLHFVADAEEQGAGVLHAPFHVGDLEDAIHGVLTGGGVHRDRQQDLVLHAVYRERAVQLRYRLTNGSDVAIHAIGTEDDFGVLRALQNGGVHPLIAGRAAALAAGGVDHQFAGRLTGPRVEAQGAALKVKVPVNGVQRAAEGELHLGLRGVDRERPGLRGDGLSGRHEEDGHTERDKQTHRFHHKVSIRQPRASPLERKSVVESSPTCMASMPAKSFGCPARARMARERKPPGRSSSSIRSARNSGRRPMRRCSAWYRERSPASSAAASATACWKSRQSPSPVMASTEPEASPTSTTLSRYTALRRRDAVTPPRSRK